MPVGAPLVCPSCVGNPALFQRPDDNEATVVERLKVYESQTRPLIKYYTKQGLLQSIDAQGDIDAITALLVHVLTTSVVKPKAKVKPVVRPKTKTKAKTKSKSNVKAKVKPKPKAKAKAKPKTRTKAKAKRAPARANAVRKKKSKKGPARKK
jgi:adenylate kinase